MGRLYYLFSITLLQLLRGKETNIFACPVTKTKQTLFEEITVKENMQANFIYLTKAENSETFNDSVFAIEIKLCENGSYHGVCKCRWLSENNAQCRNQKNVTICDVHNSEMRFSLLVKRTYSDVMWELYRQDSTPRVIKLTTLQVTYPAKVTSLQVNGREVNETNVIDENQEVSVSCSFINGKPPVNVHLLDQTGHAHSSTRNGRGPLILSLGDFRCHNVWPTIRCEAPGSELNRSVALVGRCLPQFSHNETEILPLEKVLKEGMTLRLKSYTSNIRKCHMTKSSPQPASSEVKCKLSGDAPDFNLTLLFSVESKMREGIWTLHVTTELGISNITFVLISNTARFGDRRPETTIENNSFRPSRAYRGNNPSSEFIPLKMSVILWFSLLLALFQRGNTDTNCDASERTNLKCKFSRNVNDTETDFSVYFQFDNGLEEMLVDCGWLNHKLQCLKQEGFDVTQQVSETAEISVPTRFVSANGTYKCKLESLAHENGKPCRSDEWRQEKQHEIQNNQFQGSPQENNNDDKENNTPVIAGCVSGAVVICILGTVIIITYSKRRAKKRASYVKSGMSVEVDNQSFTDDES